MVFFRFRKKRGVPSFSTRGPRRLVNPFFPKKRSSSWVEGAASDTRKTHRHDFWSIFFATVLLLASVILFFNHLSYWRVIDVTISGAQYLSTDEIRSATQIYLQRKVFFFLRGDNNLLIRTTRMQSFLQDKISGNFALRSLTVRKTSHTSLAVDIQERIPGITWVSGNQYFYVDPDGFAIQKRGPSDVDQTFPKIFDYNNLDVSLNEPVVSPSLAQLALRLFEEYQKTAFFGSSIDSFFIPPLSCSEGAVVEKHITLEDLASEELEAIAAARQKIQERLKNGEITVEESLVLLEGLDTNRKFTDKNGALLSSEAFQQGEQTAREFTARTEASKGPEEKIVFEEVSVPKICDLALVGHDLGMKMQGNWNLYLTDQVSWEEQFHKIQVLFKEKFSNSEKKPRYVDVRFEDKIFYKE